MSCRRFAVPRAASVVAALLLLATAGCRQRSPDVLVIVVDTLRADRLGAYGGPPNLTPFLDEFGASGVVFRNAYSTSSWTNPAVASLFTSRYPSQNGVAQFDSRLSDDEITLAERMAAARYRRVGFVGNFRLTEALGFGQGFDAWFPRMIGSKTTAHTIGQDAIRFYDRHIAPRPWSRWTRHPLLLYLHFMEPHAPYRPPPAARVGRVGPAPAGSSEAEATAKLMDARRWAELSTEEVSYLASLYDAEIAGLDSELARLFRRLRRRGLLEHTVVVITADHGEEFREHGSLQHGFALYQESVRIPLMVSGPGVPAGRIVTDNVSIVDVAPTLLELLGVAPEPRFEGRSLRSLFTTPADPVDIVLELEPVAESMDLRRQVAGLVYGDLVVLVRPPATGNATEAYDLRSDSHQVHPNPSSIAQESAALRARLEQRRAALATRAHPAEHAPVDQATLEHLRALGYAN